MPGKRLFTLLCAKALFLCSACGDNSTSDTSGNGEEGGGEPERCEGVEEGDVLIASDEDLAALEGIGRIDGALQISGAVTSLGLLECLSEVGGRVTIEETELRDLTGLENLLVAESLALSRNPNLVSTKGLGVEKMVGETDELSGLPLSQSLVWGNDQLIELRFDSLREVGTISIGRCGPPEFRVGNDSLGMLGGSTFPVLESGVTLAVASNEALSSVAGLVDGFASGGSFLLAEFFDNPELDGPGLRDLWVSQGLEGRRLNTCGNSGDTEVCNCPVTE